MLRITPLATNGTTTLKLEGRLVGAWADELNRVCEATLDEPRRVRLDLTDVTFADAAGIAAVKAAIQRHVEIVGCSLFLSELLRGLA